MLVLGLGSNVGDRLAHLRKAFQALQSLPDLHILQVSPIYISEALLPDNAPKEWDQPYLNLAIKCETATSPLQLLKSLKNIEWAIGRKPEIRHWGPRVLDIDILAWDDLIIESDELTLPHAHLEDRPFALWPLADVAPNWRFPKTHKTAAEIVEKWDSRFNGKAPFKTRQINQRIDAPILVGILNVTPDSFSDGNQFLNADQAYAHINNLMRAGAEVIDIGAESTAPHAKAIDAKTEWQRLQTILEILKIEKNNLWLKPKISIDTYHAETAEKACAYDIDWINDVSGLQNEAMRKVILSAGKNCVLMHNTGVPVKKENMLAHEINIVKVVYDWAIREIDSLEKFGFTRDNIIFDPGIGFGKVAAHSLELIKNIEIFKSLETKILVGHSRKSFLSLFTSATFSERDSETIAISLFMLNKPVNYLRVHDVLATAQAFKVSAALSHNAETV